MGVAMQHWFDELSKGFAAGRISRRQILSYGLKAGVFGLSSALPGSSPLAARGSDPSDPSDPQSRPEQKSRHVQLAQQRVRRGNCTFETRRNFHSHELYAAHRSLELRLHRINDYEGRHRSTRYLIHHNRAELLTFEVSRQANGLLTFSHRYSEGVRGITSSVLTSSDGRTFRGSIDGRQLVPFSIDQAPRSLNTAQFVDRRPAPTLTIPPAVEGELNGLFEAARNDMAGCRSTRRGALPAPERYAAVPPASGASTPTILDSVPVQRVAQNQAVGRGTDIDGECSDCQLSCQEALAICTAPVVVATFFVRRAPRCQPRASPPIGPAWGSVWLRGTRVAGHSVAECRV
jgi:hypothetical protein